MNYDNDALDEARAERRCSMGVGCGTAGVCYAKAHGRPEECPAPKPHPLLPAPGRAAVLAMLSTPMTRHTIAERMGCSYDSATQYIAQLQADYKVTPCGREYSPTGRGWRMQFRAIGGAA